MHWRSTALVAPRCVHLTAHGPARRFCLAAGLGPKDAPRLPVRPHDLDGPLHAGTEDRLPGLSRELHRCVHSSHGDRCDRVAVPSPMRRRLSRCDRRPTKCGRRISAHCCTPTTSVLRARSAQISPGSAAGRTIMTRSGPRFTRRRWPTIHPGADTPTCRQVGLSPRRMARHAAGPQGSIRRRAEAPRTFGTLAGGAITLCRRTSRSRRVGCWR